jgi:hypothetical protein
MMAPLLLLWLDRRDCCMGDWGTPQNILIADYGGQVNLACFVCFDLCTYKGFKTESKFAWISGRRPRQTVKLNFKLRGSDEKKVVKN